MFIFLYCSHTPPLGSHWHSPPFSHKYLQFLFAILAILVLPNCQQYKRSFGTMHTHTAWAANLRGTDNCWTHNGITQWEKIRSSVFSTYTPVFTKLVKNKGSIFESSIPKLDVTAVVQTFLSGKEHRQATRWHKPYFLWKSC